MVRKNFNEVETDLQNEGYEQIGSGLYATVYGKDEENKVIKIYRVKGNCGRIDKAYTSYINRVKRLDNAFVPKVYGCSIFKDCQGTIWAMIVLEKLKPIKILGEQRSTKILRDSLKSASIYTFESKIKDNNFINIKNKSLKIISKIIRHLHIKFKYSLDFGYANVMLRKIDNGYQLVITDPLAYYR